MPISRALKHASKRILHYLEAIFWFAIDFVWPYAPGAGDDKEKLDRIYELQLTKFRNAAKTIKTLEEFNTIRGHLERWIDAERTRRVTLEGRLNALAGLTGGSAALLGALLGNAYLRTSSNFVDKLFFGVFFYIVVQMVRAAICSMNGLRPAPVNEFTAGDLYPGSVDLAAFGQTYIGCCERVHRSYAVRNTDRTTHLLCAYRALLNSAVGVLLIISLMAVSVLFGPFSEPTAGAASPQEAASARLTTSPEVPTAMPVSSATNAPPVPQPSGAASPRPSSSEALVTAPLPSSAETSPNTGSSVAIRLPEAAVPVQGRPYWAVYFAVAPIDSVATQSAQRRAKELGYDSVVRDASCDVSVGGDPAYGAMDADDYVVTVYFVTEADALKVADAHGEPKPSVHLVQTLCLD